MSGKDCIKEILLSEYLDGELSADASENVRNHLLDCRECKGVYERLKSERCLLVEHLSPTNPPAHMKLKLLRRMNEEPVTGRHSRILDWLGIGHPFRVMSKAWSVAGASVILAAIVFSAFQFRAHMEDAKILAEIDRSGEQWAARDYSLNPFDIDIQGDPLQIKTENPFKSYLKEH
jgi:anti-sigma factor RsiW